MSGQRRRKRTWDKVDCEKFCEFVFAVGTDTWVSRGYGKAVAVVGDCDEAEKIKAHDFGYWAL